MAITAKTYSVTIVEASGTDDSIWVFDTNDNDPNARYQTFIVRDDVGDSVLHFQGWSSTEANALKLGMQSLESKDNPSVINSLCDSCGNSTVGNTRFCEDCLNHEGD